MIGFLFVLRINSRCLPDTGDCWSENANLTVSHSNLIWRRISRVCRNRSSRSTNWDSLSHRRPVWCLPVSAIHSGDCCFCLYIRDCRLNSDWCQQRVFRTAVTAKGNAFAVHRNPCRGLTRSVWLKTGDLWCENLDGGYGWLALIIQGLAMWARTGSSGYFSCHGSRVNRRWPRCLVSIGRGWRVLIDGRTRRVQSRRAWIPGWVVLRNRVYLGRPIPSVSGSEEMNFNSTSKI